MLGLSAYVILALAVEALAPLDPSSRAVLELADTGICIAFLGDFVRSLVRAPNRTRYLATWGWLDLLSSIPTLTVARWGRAARIVRIIRLLRGFRSAKNLAAFILERRAQAAFAAVTLLSLLLIVFGSIAILQFEPTVRGSNIRTPGDALWWAYVTVTTVGYGDRYPVSAEGRLLAAVLMAAGVGLFGTFTGFVTSWFVSAGKKREQGEERHHLDRLFSEVAALRTDISLLRHQLPDVQEEPGLGGPGRSDPRP